MPLQQSPPGATTRIDGREYLYFVGTGYLGLQGRAEVIRAACEGAEQYGIGSANSRTAFGTTPPVLEVERLAAAMFGMEDAFYYASGWMGNNILVRSLDRKSGVVLIDEYAHYSLFEAARWTNWRCVAFRHRNAEDLRAKLKEHVTPGHEPLVMSDGVFAATGQIAPVGQYCDVLSDYPGSVLCMDDAHGLGVLGENGRGTFEQAGLWSHGINNDKGDSPIFVDHGSAAVPAKIGTVPPCPALLFSGTLSKAVGGFGGIIPGGREFIERMKAESPYFGGASAPPAPIAAATARAIELVMAEPELRTRLWSNARRLKDGLGRMGFDVDQTAVPIVCLVAGTAENMQRMQRELMARGIAVAYMAAYAGLGPEGGLRLAVFATHTEAMIDQLLDELGRVV